ncbi:MAG: hypothetical protein ABJF10_02035 [Chthoniobacter sp.]|uniref:hypothetical protein n=1 Tax=Chthoniobacter sp. TaxID=2510640 RepID=UPI0032A964D3
MTALILIASSSQHAETVALRLAALWPEVVRGAATGLVVSIILGTIYLCRDSVRTYWLKRKLIRSLQGISSGGGIRGIVTGIANSTGRDFTVREVLMLTDMGDFVFIPTGEISTISKPPRLTRDEKRRIKKGEQIQGRTQIFYAKREHGSTEAFPVVKPFTSHSFNLPLQALTNEVKTSGMRVLIEYRTFGGEVKLLTVDSKGWATTTHQKNIEHLRSELLNGNLNRARRMFHLPEIPMPGAESGANFPVPESPPTIVLAGAMKGCAAGSTIDPNSLRD